MKIAVISSAAIKSGKEGYSGLERIAWEIANWLGKYHDVTFVGSIGSSQGNFNLVETISPGYTVPGYIEREGEHIIKAVNILKDENFDIVQVHQHKFYLETFWINSKVYEWHIHGWLPPFPPSKKIFCYARSKSHSEILKEKFMMDVDFMYNFVDVSEFPLVDKKEDYIVFFSRMSKEKGVHNFVELCKELKCRAIIAGEDSITKGIEPFYLIEVLKKINKANLEGSRIEYFGTVDEKTKVEILSRAKALVIPYERPYFEVFGIVIVESLACGTPVITYKGFGGPDEIITNEVGYLAKDFEDLKNFVRLVVNDEVKFDAKKCRERAMDFDIDKVMNDYLRKVEEKYGSLVL